MSKNPATVWISFLDDVDTEETLHLGDDIGFTIDGISENIPGILSIDTQTDLYPQWSRGLWDIEWREKDVVVSFDEMYENVEEMEWCSGYYRATIWRKDGILHVVNGQTKVHLPFGYDLLGSSFNKYWVQCVRKDKKYVFLHNKDGIPYEIRDFQYDFPQPLLENTFICWDWGWYTMIQYNENWVEDIFKATSFTVFKKNNRTDALWDKWLILFAHNDEWKTALLVCSEKGVRQLSDFDYDYISEPDNAWVMHFRKGENTFPLGGFLSIYSDGIHQTNPCLVAKSSKVHNSPEIRYKVGLMMILSKTKREMLEDWEYHTVIPFPESKKED